MRGGKAHPVERAALFLISAVALPVGQCVAQRAPGAAPLAITHVTVVDVSTGTLARDQTAVIAGDRIRAGAGARGSQTAFVIRPHRAR